LKEKVVARAKKAKVEVKSSKVEEKKAASAEAAPSSVNKAKAVRDYFGKNPTASPKEIAAALTEQGVAVAPSYVSLIKWQMKNLKGKARKPAADSATPTASTKPVSGKAGDTITVEALLQAKKLAEALGGVEIARQAMSALSRLLG